MRSSDHTRGPRSVASELGTSLLELVLAATLLLMATASFFSTLSATQSSASFATLRQQTLDDLRRTSDVFAKDARQASAVLDGMSPGRVDFLTYVGGDERVVTYEVVEVDGRLNLERREGTVRRLFVVHLTDASVFDPDSPNPSEVRTIRILLTTQPNPDRPAVDLVTEVALRNVDY